MKTPLSLPMVGVKTPLSLPMVGVKTSLSLTQPAWASQEQQLLEVIHKLIQHENSLNNRPPPSPPSKVSNKRPGVY